MNTLNNKWKLFNKAFDKNMQNALQQQHHAVQYIALTGKYLVPNQADDSNTNMQFLTLTNTVYGHKLSNGLQPALDLTAMKLFLARDFEKVSEEISLDDKTKDQVFSELKELLQSKGIDSSALKSELHYEIPGNDLDKGASFKTENTTAFEAITLYRHNAEVVLSHLMKNDPEAVRIWPHHFDTGAFIPVENDDKGNLKKSMGLGLAISDSMIAEPYFYLSFWQDDAPDSIQLADLPAGKWMMPGWNGAVLPVSALLSFDKAGDQFLAVLSFFEKGMEIIMKDVFEK